jgi:thiol-disulfide isomerase/thioredoxin
VTLLVALVSPVGASEADPPLPERLRALEGEVVVLNFWAAWCRPCRKELPLLSRLHERFAERGVAFVGASTDAVEDREQAEKLLQKSGVSYAVWYGFSDADMRPLGLGSSIPVTAVFDRDGTRVFRLIGEVSEKRLVERLEWLLGSRESDPPEELLLPPGLSSKEYQQD